MRTRPMHQILAVVVAATLACGGDPDPIIVPPPPPPPAGNIGILMLGNSLTYTHDVGALVAEFAVRGGAIRPTVVTAAYANFALEDHYNLQSSRDLAESGNYDVIVMQQGPSTLDASREHLITWSEAWRDLLDDEEVQLGLYAVWSPRGPGMNAAIENYTTAANQVGLALYPAAHAWREALRLDPDIPLYGPDEFHASPTGAMLAAMVIAATIYDQDPMDYPNLINAFVDEADMPTLRQAAKFAVDQYGKRTGGVTPPPGSALRHR